MATKRVNSRKKVSQLKTLLQLLREITAKLEEYLEGSEPAESSNQEANSSVINLENAATNVSNDAEEAKQVKVKLATTAANGKVILDVGGTRYTTSVETLTREKNTYFTAMFSRQRQLELDPKDDSIFIDRDGELFSHILAYLRTGLLPNDIMKDEDIRKKVMIEAEFFHLHLLIEMLRQADQLPASFLSDGTLVSNEQRKLLFEFCEKKYTKSQLLYKASRDGFDENSFNSRYDKQGSTITIIRSSNGCLFGGYTCISWNFNDANVVDENSFLFTLNNPHNIPPTKYPLQQSNKQYTVSQANNNGTTSNDGYSLYICSNSHSTNGSYINWPSSYTNSIGKGNNTFTDNYNFFTTDIEVFKLT